MALKDYIGIFCIVVLLFFALSMKPIENMKNEYIGVRDNRMHFYADHFNPFMWNRMKVHKTGWAQHDEKK